MKARVLGTCYVCGKSVWGFKVHPAKPYATKARYPMDDGNGGVRHSDHYPTGPGMGSERGVTLSDA